MPMNKHKFMSNHCDLLETNAIYVGIVSKSCWNHIVADTHKYFGALCVTFHEGLSDLVSDRTFCRFLSLQCIAKIYF